MPITVQCTSDNFVGFLFGGKYLTGTDRCGKLSNEITVLRLTPRNTVLARTIRPNISTKQSMGQHAKDSLLMEGQIPPPIYGARLTKLGSDDSSNLQEGEFYSKIINFLCFFLSYSHRRHTAAQHECHRSSNLGDRH